MTSLLPSYFAVEVPRGATDISFPEQDAGAAIVQYKLNGRWHTDTLPPGSYILLFLSSQVIEEQAGMVVEMFVIRGTREIKIGDYTDSFVWRKYTNKTRSYIPYCKTRVESFHSLLKSKGLDTDKNYAIIKHT